MMTGFEIPSKSLSSLDPQYIRMYLSGSGWRKTFSMENYGVYRNASDKEVHVPRRNTFLDYPARMRELLTTLSETEGRRIIDIFSDISLVNAADSIQYRISDGTISASLLDGIIDAHRSISAAAYMDLSDSKAYHSSLQNAGSKDGSAVLIRTRRTPIPSGSNWHIWTMEMPVQPAYRWKEKTWRSPIDRW